MSWFIYALVCALSLATADALSKKALDDNTDPYIVAWASGLEISTSYALPDANILTMTDFFNVASSMN